MRSILAIIIMGIIFTGCRSKENKVDNTGKETTTDTTVIAEPTPAEEKPVEKKPESTQPVDRSPDVSPPATKPNRNPDIISRIDDHLVSTASFTPGATGGMTNASVTVKNKLSNITIQRALLEVSIRNADGSEVRTDYYTVVNLEPGGSKLVPIPNQTKGSKMVLHIVKVKSDQLTNGEFVLAGSHAQK